MSNLVIRVISIMLATLQSTMAVSSDLYVITEDYRSSVKSNSVDIDADLSTQPKFGFNLSIDQQMAPEEHRDDQSRRGRPNLTVGVSDVPEKNSLRWKDESQNERYLVSVRGTTRNRRRILAACCESIQGCTDCSTSDCGSCQTCAYNYFNSPYWGEPCRTCKLQYGPSCRTCDRYVCLTCDPPWEADPLIPNKCRCSLLGFPFGSNVTCTPCMPYCTSCSSATTCDSCETHFTLTGANQCEPCTPGCHQCSSTTTCSVCQAGYGLSGPVGNVVCTLCGSTQYSTQGSACTDCDYTKCATCIGSASNCTSCNTGFVMIEGRGICESACPEGKYFDYSTAACADCHANCETCFNSNDAKDCGRCKTNTILYKETRDSGGCVLWQTSPRTSTQLAYTIRSGRITKVNYGIARSMSRFAGRVYGKLTAKLSFTYDGNVQMPYGACDTTKVQLAQYPYNYDCKTCSRDHAWLDDLSCLSQGLVEGYYIARKEWDQGRISNYTATPNCLFEWNNETVISLCTTCKTGFNLKENGSCPKSCKPSETLNVGTQVCDLTVPGCAHKDSSGNCTSCSQMLIFTPNNGTTTCTRCPANCTTCDSLGTCLTCAPGYQRETPTGLCLFLCKEGLYYDTSTQSCQTAHASCKTAGSSATECTSCSTGHALQGTSCLTLCSLGQYYDAAMTNCLPCHNTCLGCFNGSSTGCFSCPVYALLTGGSCVNITCHTSLAATCESCTSGAINACIKPADGYYLGFFNQPVVYRRLCNAGFYYDTVSKTCIACAPECSLCSGPSKTDCIYCAVNYFRQGSVCTINPNSCLVHAGETINPTNLSCLTCTVANCLECTTAGFCTHCATGYFSTVAGSCSPCTNNTIYCQDLTGLSLSCLPGYTFKHTQNCTKCNYNQYLDDNYGCRSCNSSCLGCTDRPEYCADCLPGDFRYPFPAVVVNFNRPCHQLKNLSMQGYYSNSGVPTPCVHPCLKCSSASICLACHSGYYLSITSCLPCDSTCHRCTGPAPTQCISCHMGYSLSAGTCTQICDKYEYFNSTINKCLLCPRPCAICNETDPSKCLTCQIDRYLNGTVCLPCHESCSSCTGPQLNQCTECSERYMLSSGICVVRNPTTFNVYFDPSLDAVYMCHKFCKTCTGPSPFNCTSCLTGFTLELNSFTPDYGATPAGFCKRDCDSSMTLVHPYPNECFPCHTACAQCNGPSQDNCVSCSDGYYLEGRICKPCSSYCETCDGPSSFDCLTCHSSWTLEAVSAPLGYCRSVLTCAPTGEYLHYGSNRCEACHAGCQTCFGPLINNCLSCYPVKPKLIGPTSTCSPECPDRHYYDTSLSRCELCHSSCSVCFSPSDINCSICLTPGYRVQASPTICALNCSVTGYVDTTNTTHCQPCHKSCATCLGPTITNCTSCYPGKTLRIDSSCQADCGPGNYYMPDTDTCGICHASCKDCTGGSRLECISCNTSDLLQPDGSCEASCQPQTYLNASRSTCLPCYPRCASCDGPTDTSCTTCISGLLLMENRSCTETCPNRTYENVQTKSCEFCHSSCHLCSGPTNSQCTSCVPAATSVITQQGACADCAQSDFSPDLCPFTAILKLQEAAKRFADKRASTTLQITFQNHRAYIDRLQSQPLKETFRFEIDRVPQSEYQLKIDVRQGEILVDLFFSTSQTGTTQVRVYPLKIVALTNNFTDIAELIFVNKSSTVEIHIKNAPNGAVAGTFENIEAASATSTTAVGAIVAAGTGLVTGFPFLAEPLMKCFRVFKIVSRLRLINVYFGAYLESFLSVCNNVFKVGGDSISKDELLAAPATRGKLEDYRVSVVASQVVGWKYAVFILALLVRYYRAKIRKYAVSEMKLELPDRLANKVAESLRMVLFTVVGIDIFFYSLHCMAHVYYRKEINFSVDINLSLFLSYFGLFFILWDFLILINTNRRCNFFVLRRNYRLERKVLGRKVLPSNTVKIEGQPTPTKEVPTTQLSSPFLTRSCSN